MSKIAIRNGLVLLLLVTAIAAFWQRPTLKMGKQADGSYLVSSGQHIEGGAIEFKGRPSDLALSPDGKTFAVLAKSAVFLCTTEGVIDGSSTPLSAEAGYRGIVWTPDGKRVIVSTADGYLATFDRNGDKLERGPKVVITQAPQKHPRPFSAPSTQNPVPGGLAMTSDGKNLFVAACDLDAVVQVDLTTGKPVDQFAVEKLPFQVRLTPDQTHLLCTNWGGRVPAKGDRVGPTEKTEIVVDEKGAAATGSLSIIDLASGEVVNVPVGVHPTDVVVDGNHAYVANSLSDTISEVDIAAHKVTRTIPIKWANQTLFGCMPVALAESGGKLYACDGGDNALCEIDLASGRVSGFRPAGYYPIAMTLQGSKAIVLNSKGYGSVANTAKGRIGNAHDFQGTVSVIDLSSDLAAQTQVVAHNNGWDRPNERPKLAVYNGAIQHVLYIIKENRTYDEYFGDMPEGNGDAKLCDIGEPLAPNHRALAREFTLFDNSYVSGTNSCDGHAWSTQSLADDYIEHFYVGYSRTYNDDGNCSMSLASSGCIWDAAAKKNKSIRVYGEYCVADNAEYQPYRPKDWFEAWKDRQAGTHKFKYIPHAVYASVKPYLCPDVHYWPLIQSDQSRADAFINEYDKYSQQNKVPNLMVFALPCDHTEGTNPDYPAPKSMIADNDLALGRIVDAVSHSPQWKNTCIFVIEDDAQSGPDHVDGHRTAYEVISPYNRRHTVDSNMYTTTNMLRSIEMMLGLDPMNRFDSLARPIDSCFVDEPDLTPYNVKPNNIPLDLPNPERLGKMTPTEKYWTEKCEELNWSHLDAPDSYWLNRIIWASLHPDNTPYPGRPGEKPGEMDD